MNDRMRNMPKTCPSCGGVLEILAMHCRNCDTRIEGHYALPLIMQLSDEEQRFVLDFILCSGSLKEMARQLGVSYPSVRNRLDQIISQLQLLKTRLL